MISYCYAFLNFITQGQFWLLGNVITWVCLCVHVLIMSLSVEAGITKFGPEV